MLRRTWLKTALAFIGSLPFLPSSLRAQAEAGFSEASLSTLHELSAVVLPPSLGRKRTDEAADGFARWVRGYRAGADTEHGYGFTRIRPLPPSPLPTYLEQLRALEAAAGAKGSRFADLPAETKRQLTEASLAKIERLPYRPDGKNIAADLMAFFFRSSEANDLCYRADIGRDRCRGLPGSEHAPAAMKGGR